MATKRAHSVQRIIFFVIVAFQPIWNRNGLWIQERKKKMLEFITESKDWYELMSKTQNNHINIISWLASFIISFDVSVCVHKEMLFICLGILFDVFFCFSFCKAVFRCFFLKSTHLRYPFLFCPYFDIFFRKK